MEQIGGTSDAPRELLEFYGRADTIGDYHRSRFESPIGAHLHARQAVLLRRLLAREAPESAIELACGTGRLSPHIAESVPDCVALDASLGMAVNARASLHAAHPGIAGRTVVADAFEPPFRRRFDLVVTFRFLRHFSAEDRRRLLQSCRSLLRQGGTLAFDAVNRTASQALTRQPLPGATRVYDWLSTPRDLGAELNEAGFDRVSLTGVLHAYRVLHRIQVLIGPRSPRIAAWLVAAFDRLGTQPLEWVVTCRRK
jgi:SAM-dependent methyltransferase